MHQVNNQTEKEYRDKQTFFGHMSNATDLDTWLRDNYWPGSIRERRYRKVAERFLSTDKKLNVLEIAAGVGDFIIFCSKLFPQHDYTANELSEIQLKNNIQNVASHFGVKEIPELSFGPVERLDFKDNSFDLIYIKAAVHHFEEPFAGFKEIHRVLKKGGKVIFFEDPVCLNIPIYKNIKKRNFSLAERSLGVNEHLYTVSEYMSFGRIFSHQEKYLDEVLINEFDIHQTKRKGIKKILGSFIRNMPKVFNLFMVWRFSPIIFVFEK